MALILDGNGRWAARRGLPRSLGHRVGAKAVRAVIEAAPAAGIGTLTLFAFSADNWKRPAAEVAALMGLFERYLEEQTARSRDHGVRLNIIGRRDRLNPGLQETIGRVEHLTRGGRKLLLRVAIDYSARQTLALAVERLVSAGAPEAVTQGNLARALEASCHSVPDVPPVDLLLRTGGEQRLSDFLLWECAYAELRFSPVLWPDFSSRDLRQAVADFGRRERRFGGLPEQDPTTERNGRAYPPDATRPADLLEISTVSNISSANGGNP